MISMILLLFRKNSKSCWPPGMFFWNPVNTLGILHPPTPPPVPPWDYQGSSHSWLNQELHQAFLVLWKAEVKLGTPGTRWQRQGVFHIYVDHFETTVNTEKSTSKLQWEKLKKKKDTTFFRNRREMETDILSEHEQNSSRVQKLNMKTPGPSKRFSQIIYVGCLCPNTGGTHWIWLKVNKGPLEREIVIDYFSPLWSYRV